jgi:hypothetical protein
MEETFERKPVPPTPTTWTGSELLAEAPFQADHLTQAPNNKHILCWLSSKHD